MKKVYICGDSFGCPALNWSIDPWPVLLSKKLGDNYSIVNLSISCASNLLIRLQVDVALDNQADFVILLATTCTRSQGHARSVKESKKNLYDRFVRIGQHDHDHHERDLACYSIRSLDETCVFSHDNIVTIRNYQSRMFDLDLAIYENQCIIESSLHALKQKRTPFLFDQGGFENPMFGDVRKVDYFTEFDMYKSKINQWSLTKFLPKLNMAHFHIVDPAIHDKIASYYHYGIIHHEKI